MAKIHESYKDKLSSRKSWWKQVVSKVMKKIAVCEHHQNNRTI